VRRVAETYFTVENRAVALYYRQEGSGVDDPLLTGLDDQERPQVGRMRPMIAQATAEQLEQLQAQIDQMAAQAPPENQDMVTAVRGLVEQRLADLEATR